MELRVRNVPDELHLRIKLLAVTQRKTVNEKIIELLQKAVEEERKDDE